MLSFLLAIMTALTIAVIGWPILRPRRLAPPPRREHDLAVYRDQLAELERDQARGVIDADQARAARLEIERRLLAAAKQQERPPTPRPMLRHTTLALAVLLPLCGFAYYLMTGRPDLPAVPFAEQVRLEHNNPQAGQRAIEELQQRLAQKPDDLPNWILLGRTALLLGQYKVAADAYGRAVGLAQNRPDVLAAYAEALIMANDGTVSPAALQALDSALAKEPNDPGANFYRGAADLQAGNTRAALERWLAIEARAPEDASYLPELRRHIALAAKESGIDPQSIRPDRKTPPAASGPSADDVDRMSKLSPQEREQAIRGMVDGLEERLKATPDDVEGWRRLGRSRLALNQPDKAAAAFAEADKRQPNDKTILADLAEAQLRLTPNTAMPAPAAIATLRKLLAVDADNALALYFLSEVEAAAGNKAVARDMLDRLLKQIPANAPQRGAIEARRKALE